MHINDINSNEAGIFKDTLTALGLTQHVTTSTHVKSNILDLIFTEETSSIKPAKLVSFYQITSL